jgi:transcriptional regulator with XRE-family HTH domain
LKRQLGDALRNLRVAADVTVAEVAGELGSSEAKVRHLENGRNVPSKPDLTVMIGLYRASAARHEELEDLRQAASSRGWWSSYRLPTWFQTYVGLEADAASIREFELEMLPGLLQTEAYARVIHTIGPREFSTAEIDRLIEVRLRRQELITGVAAVTFHAVVSEAAFHRLRGTGSDITVEQCRHLITMAERPNVTIQVLPFSAGLHTSMAGDFLLLTFPRNASKPIAYFEYAFGGQLQNDRRVVDQMSGVHEKLAAISLDAADSIDFIARWT